MADENNNIVRLEDGTILYLNLNKITIAEYRELFRDDTDNQRGDELLARVVDRDYEFVSTLGFDDYQKISRKFWELVKRASTPDPN